MTISVILPTFNEKDNILEIIKRITKAIEKLPYRYEILVVDDNSPDRTGVICKRYFLKNKRIKIFIRKNEKGFASAIFHGISKSIGDVVIVMDTDFSHNPSLIPLMLTKIKKCDMVIGSRYANNGGGENKKRFWMSKMANIYLKYILRVNVSDFLFGYFCIRRDFLFKNNLLNREIFSGFGDYFIRLSYFVNKSGGRIVEIPAYYKDRIHGESKSDLRKMLITYTWTSLQLLTSDLPIFKAHHKLN